MITWTFDYWELSSESLSLCVYIQQPICTECTHSFKELTKKVQKNKHNFVSNTTHAAYSRLLNSRGRLLYPCWMAEDPNLEQVPNTPFCIGNVEHAMLLLEFSYIFHGTWITWSSYSGKWAYCSDHTHRRLFELKLQFNFFVDFDQCWILAFIHDVWKLLSYLLGVI